MSDSRKIALVTGASRGIGAAIAKTLASDEIQVIGTATSESGASKIEDTLNQNGGEHRGMVLDVSDKAAIDSFFKTLKSEFGQGPDILVNNAGITRDNLTLRMKDNEWEDILATNLSSIFYLSKLCLKTMMKNHWGRIISIGSVVGSTGGTGQANYSAAKAGVMGFSKSLASEIATRGITVNVVSPGFIETDMTAVLSEEQKNTIFAHIPMQRLGQAQEVADAVEFLASKKAAYITGQTLHVNGGMYMN